MEERFRAWQRCSEVEGLAYAEYFELKTYKGKKREALLGMLLEMMSSDEATLRGNP